MESFDVAVAFRVMIGRAPMRDAKPVQCFDKPRRSELSPVIGGQRHTGLASARGQPFQCRLLDRCAPFAEPLDCDLSRQHIRCISGVGCSHERNGDIFPR